MPQRRRYATRDELVALLAGHINASTSDVVDETSVSAVLDALAQHGAATETLVKITVDEDVAPDLQ